MTVAGDLPRVSIRSDPVKIQLAGSFDRSGTIDSGDEPQSESWLLEKLTDSGHDPRSSNVSRQCLAAQMDEISSILQSRYGNPDR